MQNLSESNLLFLTPSYKDYLWGGQQIIKLFNRDVQLNICAESWEASDRKEGHCYIKRGKHQGRSLKELIEEMPSLFGFKKFPLLIKLIDAASALSIQVHPSIISSQKHGGEPKSEMWHILEASKGSKIYLGLKENLTREEILQAIELGNLQNYMHAIEVSKGETYYIPGGLIHSIGSGCLIYEVQQNSNTTYRLYDWDRLDKQGKSRELHITDALNAMNSSQVYVDTFKGKDIVIQSGVQYKELINSDFFIFNKLFLRNSFHLITSAICRLYFVMEGDLIVETKEGSFTATKGTSFIVPAHIKGLEVKPKGHYAEVLETIAKL